MPENEEKKGFTKDDLTALFSTAKKVKVVFEKKDGTIRTMICTRDQGTIPEEHRPAEREETEERPKRTTPEHLFPVFDLENNASRSFTIEKVISAEPIL